MSYDKINNNYKAFTTELAKDTVLKNVKETVVDPRWKDAINEERKALNKNQTWEISNLPRGKHLVGCKWVSTIKYKADGTMERYKAWFVAKEYTQTFGVDYGETFTQVEKLNSIRIILSLVANRDWLL